METTEQICVVLKCGFSVTVTGDNWSADSQWLNVYQDKEIVFCTPAEEVLCMFSIAAFVKSEEARGYAWGG